MNQNDKPVTAVAVSDKRLYLVSVLECSEVTKEQTTMVYRRKNALEVLKEIAKRLGLEKIDESKYDPESDTVEWDGEVANRGDYWLYSDLSIAPVREDTCFYIQTASLVRFENGEFRVSPCVVEIY